MPTEPTTAAERLREQVLAAIQQYERENASDNPASDQLAYVRWIADHYADRGLELAAICGPEDIRALRAAGEAATAATPAVITRCVGQGMTPQQIALRIGLTESRVYGIIREQRRKETREIIAAGVAADPDPQASYEKWKRVLSTATDPAEREQAELFLAEFRAVLDATAPAT